MWKRMTLLLGLGALALLVWVSLASAQNGYDLSWWTVDGGGLISSQGGGYILAGTVGQSDAGPAHTGGGYSLTGGFWPAAAGGVGGQEVYLPVILRQR
jgi:hypothetical protein